ncbi:MAG TPA: hypothetical protein PLP33_25900 [Leptospiraceae bacterium]|nr:hypothetical protein [Leptospiraceae bacterium]
MKKRQYNFWSDEETQKLANLFNKVKSYNELAEHFPTHGIESIKTKICKLRLEKTAHRKNHCENLLEQTPEAYYWLGFLLADGSFSIRKITLTVSAKDIEHMKKFMNFIQSTNSIRKITGSECYRFSFTNVKVIKELINRFSISTNKTKNPSDLFSYTEDQDLLFSLIVGYIDGDGSISLSHEKYPHLNVVGHESWLNNFTKIFAFIHEMFSIKPTNKLPTVRTSSTNLPQDKGNFRDFQIANINITNRPILKAMHHKVKELNLPVLDRKWSKLKNI